VLEIVSAATDLDLISYFKAIPDARMRRGVRIPAWYLLLVAVLGILSRCQSLRDLDRFAIRHHSVLTAALVIELRRSPSDSAFRYFFQHVVSRHRKLDQRFASLSVTSNWCRDRIGHFLCLRLLSSGSHRPQQPLCSGCSPFLDAPLH